MLMNLQGILHWFFFSISILAFSIVCFPQIKLNYILKTNSLSIHFIFLWIVADFLNGSYSLHQLLNKNSSSYVAVILPFFNTLTSLILLGQHVAYTKHINKYVFCAYIVTMFSICFFTVYFQWILALGWIVFSLYLLAPIVQIVQIYREKSTKGLTTLTFCLLIISNVCFILSEVLITGVVVSPIVLKSFVLIVLYISILLQFVIYIKY